MTHLTNEELVNLAAALGGGVGVKAVEAIVGLVRRKRAEPSAVARAHAEITRANAEFQEAVAEAAKDLLADYRDQLHFVRGRCDALEAKLDETERKHAAALAASEAAHSACQATVAELRRQLEKFMSEQPAIPHLLGPPSER